MDLGEMAPREAAVEQGIQVSDAGRERPPTLLAPQRRLVGLETASAEQVLEGALALGQGRRKRDGGERDGIHSFRFFFAINDRSWAGARQSRTPCGRDDDDPHPFDSVRGEPRAIPGLTPRATNLYLVAGLM